MALKPTKKTVILLEADIYIGTCYAVIDLGEQYNERYKKTSHMIMLMWEIADEYVEIDGKQEPRVISKDYALVWNDRANLTKLIESWFGKGVYNADTFEANVCLGKSCQLDISAEINEAGTAYNKVVNIARLAKGQQGHTPKELLYYEFDDPTTHDVFEKIPEWVQAKIKRAVNYKNIVDIPEEPQEESQPTENMMTPISTDEPDF